MRIEVFSDVVCPWCAIGERRLQAALARFSHRAETEVVWRSFELDPHAPRRREGSYAGRLARKYGMSVAQAQAANERMTALGASVGLDFRFDLVQPGNTFDAHRLLHHALRSGPASQRALAERLFTAYFSEGAPIGEPATLLALAGGVGLDSDECASVLAGDRYADDVRSDEQAAIDLGVTGVPHFVIAGKYSIPGAQDDETMLVILERAWAQTQPAAPTGAPT
jgi:predicted DsbA family dithiol-disulfide isomerase